MRNIVVADSTSKIKSICTTALDSWHSGILKLSINVPARKGIKARHTEPSLKVGEPKGNNRAKKYEEKKMPSVCPAHRHVFV